MSKTIRSDWHTPLEIIKSEALKNKMRGKIVRLFADKGFGFIKADDNKEYFVHYTGCSKADWNTFTSAYARGEEMLVEFTPSSSPKGPRAEDVTPYA